MAIRPSIPTQSNWIAQIFTAQAVRDGGVVRRSVWDVRKFASFAMLKREVVKRGFHLIRTGDQYVILCHQGDIRIFC
jgi:hypothetical protein